VFDKWKLYDILGYKTYHSEVQRFHESNARIKICCAPRRTTKSYSASHDPLPDLIQNEDFRIWIVGPSYELAEKEFRYMHEALVIKMGLKPIYARTNARSGKPILEFEGKRIIEAKSAENQNQLLGEAVDVAIYSEAAQLPRGIRERFVKPCLTTKKGREIVPTTPDAKGEWVNELFGLGQTQNDLGIDSFTWDRTANPKYDDAEFQWAKRFYGEDSPVFREQYLGEWVFYGGLVYPTFSESLHVIPPFSIPKNWRVVRGIDFGFRDPFVCLWAAIGPHNELYFFQEYYQREGRSIREHAVNIKALSRGLNIFYTVGDPTEKQAIEDLNYEGVSCDSANNDKTAGRLRAMEYLAPSYGPPPYGLTDYTEQKWPHAYIFNTCVEMRREFRYYRWIETRQVQDEKEKTEGEDHAMDIFRYICMTRPSPYKESRRLPSGSFNAILNKIKSNRFVEGYLR
jgi:hypothetical protein